MIAERRSDGAGLGRHGNELRTTARNCCWSDTLVRQFISFVSLRLKVVA